MTEAKETGLYSPITKSIGIEETLMLIELTMEYESVSEWQDEALFRLPQASRSRRLEIVRDTRRKFLQTENDLIVPTPLRVLLTWPPLGQRLKRDLLFAQYLRTTPLVWEAVKTVVLPHAEGAMQPLADPVYSEIMLDEWMEFLNGRLNTDTTSTVAKTRKHITGHLTKFGLLEDQPIPGQRLGKQFFARFYEPDPRAFWFSLALEFSEKGWTSRSQDFIATNSWTRIAYCTRPTYARFAIEEAERSALVMTEFFGSEKQITLRGSDPVVYVAEAIQYG